MYSNLSCYNYYIEELEIMKRLAEKLREARKRIGFSQEYVAKSLGLPRTAVTQIECGNREVSAEELAGFCKLYRLSADYLINTDKVETNQTMFARAFDELDDNDQQEILNLIAFKKSMSNKK